MTRDVAVLACKGSILPRKYSQTQLGLMREDKRRTIGVVCVAWRMVELSSATSVKV